MSRSGPDDTRAKLAGLKREVRRAARWPATPAARAASSPADRGDWLPAVVALFKVFVIVALPFYVYVRSSVYLYGKGMSAWLAVATGALLTMAIVAVYATWLSRRLAGRRRARSTARWIAMPLVAAWCAYAVVYLASANAKTPEIRRYYGSVHPVLRAALGTAILVDPDIVVTDGRREPQDDDRMGLPVNTRTLHYRQRNGWVHAVDLRTRGRSPVRNAAVQLYFASMGFSTLRHVGTADHLHVSLSLPRAR